MSDKPKYRIIKDYITGLIQDKKLQTGDRLPSENKLSDQFQFSRHTVRQAIGELANEGYIVRLHGKGTFIAEPPSKNMDRKRIGIITTYLSDYIFPKIINGIDEELSRAGYSYILNCTFNDAAKERAALLNLLDQDIQGLIIEPTKSALENPNLDLYHRLIEKGVKIVFIHGGYADLQAPYIAQDDVMGGYKACKYLAEQGHQKIGGIFKYNDIQGRLRFKGMDKAVKEHRIRLKDADVLWFNEYSMPPDGLCLFSLDAEDEPQKKLSKKQVHSFVKSHDAIVIYNEMVAITIMEVIKKMKLKIPDDIAIITFDDSDIARAVSPKLTTIAHPKEELGRCAAEKLIKMIENNQEKPESVKLSPELIIRKSGLKVAAD